MSVDPNIIRLYTFILKTNMRAKDIPGEWLRFHAMIKEAMDDYEMPREMPPWAAMAFKYSR